ncbi:hypothetical protein [Actinomadura sp. GTD37]|uniref:hypothetical protein n=1 Tax=Actinomadura sp. GTD37 TaxID=1778030 RepID=UPI0035C0E172
MNPRDGVEASDATAQAKRAVHDALAFLDEAAETGATSSLVAFDPSFSSPREAAGARAHIQRRLGVDIGYDLGGDLWAAICGLPLLPPGRDRLAGHFARLIERGRVGRRFRFFAGRNGFPADTDCTAVAGHALYERGLIPPGELTAIAEELLRAAAPDGGEAAPQGVPTVYWADGAEPHALPRSRTRDPVVCANVLVVLEEARRLGLHGAGAVIGATRRYVLDHLASGAYRGGTRYYPAPEAFLYAASRLAAGFPELAAPLARAITERDAADALNADALNIDALNIDALTTDALTTDALTTDALTTDALNIALRGLAAHNIGWRDGRESRLRALLALQAPDGSWPAHPYFKLGRLPVFFGSPVMSTLFASAAIGVSTAQGGRSDFS